MMNRALVGNILLLALAVGVAILVGLAVWVSIAPHSGPREGDEYPFPSAAEFPAATEDDRVALASVAAAFLRDMGWSPPAGESRGWYFADVAVLTLDGRRAGTYGLLTLDAPVDLSGNRGPVLCGSPLDSWEWDGAPTSVMALYVALLDGRSQPYHILPVTDVETFPQAGDLGQALSEKCD